MDEQEVERVAKLMIRASRRWFRSFRSIASGSVELKKWNELEQWRRDLTAAVARAVLADLKPEAAPCPAKS